MWILLIFFRLLSIEWILLLSVCCLEKNLFEHDHEHFQLHVEIRFRLGNCRISNLQFPLVSALLSTRRYVFFPRFTWILVFSHSLITTLLTLLYHYTLHRLLNLIIVQFFFQFKVFVPRKHQPVHLLLLLTSMSTPALEQTQDSTSPLPSSSFHSVQHHKKSNDNFASSTFIVVVSLSSS